MGGWEADGAFSASTPRLVLPTANQCLEGPTVISGTFFANVSQDATCLWQIHIITTYYVLLLLLSYSCYCNCNAVITINDRVFLDLPPS